MEKEIDGIGRNHKIPEQHPQEKKEGYPENDASCPVQLLAGKRRFDKGPELVKNIGKGQDQSADQDHREPHAELARHLRALEP